MLIDRGRSPAAVVFCLGRAIARYRRLPVFIPVT
jgi:hypothetical protein